MFAEVLCVAVALVLYVNTLGADFCYDDRYLEARVASRHTLLSSAPKLWPRTQEADIIALIHHACPTPIERVDQFINTARSRQPDSCNNWLVSTERRHVRRILKV